MKTRLIAGTINHIADDSEWHNIHLDVSDRGIHDAEIGAMVQPDVVADLSQWLPMFADDTFDEVRAHHVLEHLTSQQGLNALIAIYRVLKPGGEFDVEVPDMDRICDAWVKRDHSALDLQQWVFGEQLANHEPGDNHRFGYNEELLRERLVAQGFEVGEREETDLALRLIARKP